MGTQMMPLVWRIMNATLSGVACSAAMMRSPSFSRSSSSMITTMRPARSSATISATELSSGAGPGAAPLPGMGTILDMACVRLVGHASIPEASSRPPRVAAGPYFGAGGGSSGTTTCVRVCSVTALPASSRARTVPVRSMIQVIGTASGGPKPLALALAASAAG